jgi:large subunit ribosomal protein L21
MYAIVKIAGQQVRAEKGHKVMVPKLELAEGTRHRFAEVLLVTEEGKTQVGQPLVAGAAVEATVVGHGRDQKIEIYKMRRRKNYRRRKGHRQYYTELRIEDILLAN